MFRHAYQARHDEIRLFYDLVGLFFSFSFHVSLI